MAALLLQRAASTPYACVALVHAQDPQVSPVVHAANTAVWLLLAGPLALEIESSYLWLCRVCTSI